MTTDLPISEAEPKRVKKAYVRRLEPDRSQQWRRATQILFLLLNVWVGIQFYLFVRQFETGANSITVSRPPGVEGWLPIAGMMNSFYWARTGFIPRVHPAAMVLFLAFVGMSLLLRKSFCGWLCPVGTLSEYLWKLGRETFRRNFALPRWLDLPLRSLKYLLFGFFLWAVAFLTAAQIEAFQESPYGLVADVKMLNFFRLLTPTGAVVLGILVIASVFIQNFWCRYLCPYGALMGLASLFSPSRITRNANTCIDCGKCAKACPSRLPVDQLIQIRSAECIGCLECTAVCPVEKTLDLHVVPMKKRVPVWAVATGILLIFVTAVGAARWTGHWHSEIRNDVYRELVPQANELGHP